MAPDRTIAPATRVTKVLVDLLVDVGEERAHRTSRAPGPGPEFHDSVREIRAFAGADVPDDVMSAGLTAWAGLIGAVTLELFGHLENAVSDRDAWFAALVDRLDPTSA